MEQRLTRHARGQSRVPVELMVELAHDGWSEVYEADATNVSRGGLGLRGTVLPEVGQKLQCRFAVPESGEFCTAEGEVVWANDTPRTQLKSSSKGNDAARGEFGVRFAKLDAGAEVLLHRFVGEGKKLEHRPAEKVLILLEKQRIPLEGEVLTRAGNRVRVEQPLPMLQCGELARLRIGTSEESAVLEHVTLRTLDGTPKMVMEFVITAAAPLPRPPMDEPNEFPTGNREVGSHTEEFADEPSQVRAISSAGMLPSPTLAREAVATTHKLDDNHPEVSWHDPAELLPAATDEATLEDSQDASESAALAANDPWITDSEASLNESRSAEASLERLSLHDSNESVNVWSLAEPNAEISNTSKRASLWVRAASWLGRSAGALDRWKTARAETAAARSVDEASVGEDQPIVAELAVASAAVEREESLPRVDVQVDVQVDAQEEALAQDTGDFAGDPTGEAQQETPFYKTAAKQLVGFAALMAIGYGGALMVERYTTQETVSATTPAATEEVVANAPESDEAAREQLERVPSATPIVATSVSASDSIATSASPGGLTFGDDAPTNARTTVLNFAGPIARIEGERLEDGFNVTVFGAVCLDRAFPIAEANAQVDRATVLNGNQEAELFVRFVPGRESAYRVVASGNQLEVSIGH